MDLDRRIYFPFSAIVGMEKAKLALLAVAVDPTIGGVLLSGDKGTGKSTLVRALAQVLPEIPVVKGCPFNCNPFNPMEMCDYHYEAWKRGEKLEVEYRRMRVVDLPLNVTPDRLVGSIDVEKTLREGRVVFRPGILAEANRNILYIDEVNLLEDYIADLLLDAAASGWNIVEREGISFRHPARFILVGSMNPEEGELRPQLLDRFGLYVDVSASMSVEERMEIVRRVEEFHRDPISFVKKFEAQENEIRNRVTRAREIINEVVLDNDLLKLIVETVVKLGIRTHRAEIVVAKTAKAIAALDGRKRVTIEDVKKAMELALPHRLRSRPFEEPSKKLNEVLNEVLGTEISDDKSDSGSHDHSHAHPFSYANPSDSGGTGATGLRGGSTSVIGKKDLSTASTIELPLAPSRRSDGDEFGGGRASRRRKIVAIASCRGIAIDAVPPLRLEELRDVDLYASIRSAIARQPRVPIEVNRYDVRIRVRKTPVPVLHIVLLDASGSMFTEMKLDIAAKLVSSIASRCYIERTYVSLITFRGREARIDVYPTRFYRRVLEAIRSVEIGGSTPLTYALHLASSLAKTFVEKYRGSKVVIHIVTDGKPNVFLFNDINKDLEHLYNIYRKLRPELHLHLVESSRSLSLVPTADTLIRWIENLGGYIHRYTF